jgi:hypothetical protein
MMAWAGPGRALSLAKGLAHVHAFARLVGSMLGCLRRVRRGLDWCTSMMALAPAFAKGLGRAGPCPWLKAWPTCMPSLGWLARCFDAYDGYVGCWTGAPR